MSDGSVHAALRSEHPLVLVEAPAGCGKTYQGAEYARELVKSARRAAGRSFSRTRMPPVRSSRSAPAAIATPSTSRPSTASSRASRRLITRALDFRRHERLGAPAGQGRSRRTCPEGVRPSEALSDDCRVARAPPSRSSFATSIRIQAATSTRSSWRCSNRARSVRVFADPMQKIFSDKELDGACPPCDWNDLKNAAHACEELDVPHRWKDGSPRAWRLDACRAKDA